MTIGLIECSDRQDHFGKKACDGLLCYLVFERRRRLACSVFKVKKPGDAKKSKETEEATYCISINQACPAAGGQVRLVELLHRCATLLRQQLALKTCLG